MLTLETQPWEGLPLGSKNTCFYPAWDPGVDKLKQGSCKSYLQSADKSIGWQPCSTVHMCKQKKKLSARFRNLYAWSAIWYCHWYLLPCLRKSQKISWKILQLFYITFNTVSSDYFSYSRPLQLGYKTSCTKSSEQCTLLQPERHPKLFYYT